MKYLYWLLVGCMAWIGIVPVAVAQDEPARTLSSAYYAYGQVMYFQLRAENMGEINMGNLTGITLFLQTPELANTLTADVPVPAKFGATLEIEHALDLTQIRLAPFTTVTYWWVLATDAGRDIRIPEQMIVYEDDQFSWREVSQENITVHWTGDDPALGQIGWDVVNESLPGLYALVPVGALPPLNVYVYPSSADLRSALRLTGRDWVGAHAHPELGVLLVTAVNSRTAATDLRRSLPHEMIHFLLYQATGSGYNNLPVWFNEGLATLVEPSPNPGYAALLETAVSQRSTIPFAELCNRFPTNEEQTLLAYAQSVSLLRFIQARYGNKAISDLVAVFADGADCKSGVERVLDTSLDSLTASWLQAEEPRSFMAQFLQESSLWLLLLGGSLAITGLILLTPVRKSDS